MRERERGVIDPHKSTPTLIDIILFFSLDINYHSLMHMVRGGFPTSLGLIGIALTKAKNQVKFKQTIIPAQKDNLSFLLFYFFLLLLLLLCVFCKRNLLQSFFNSANDGTVHIDSF